MKAKDNREVDEKAFRERWDAVTAEVVKRFRKTHAVAGRERVRGGWEREE